VDLEGHGGLQLTELARPLLKGQSTLQLKKIIKRDKTKKAEKLAREKLTKSVITIEEQPLWEALRNLRMQLAQAQNVPPFTIFHDSTLLEVVKRHPSNLGELRKIQGIGEHKFTHYGGLIFEVLQQFPKNRLINNSLSETINTTLGLVLQGKDLSQIASERHIKVDTLYQHLAQAITVGVVSIHEVLPISEEAYNHIVNTFELLSSEGETKLKPVYEALEGAYDYGVLACVRAALGQSPSH
jgi:ATP-dependent DNA helicase RecQ